MRWFLSCSLLRRTLNALRGGVPTKSDIAVIPWGSGHGHPHGHDHVEVVLLARRSHEPRAERSVEQQLDLILSDHTEGVQDVAGVESDLDFGSVDVRRHLRLAVPDLVGGGGEGEDA